MKADFEIIRQFQDNVDNNIVVKMDNKIDKLEHKRHQ
jgi:hypothetical protein